MTEKSIGTFWSRHGWTVIAAVFVTFFSFSIIGFDPCIGSDACKDWLSDEVVSPWDILFFSLQMLILNYGGIHGDAPMLIQIARFGLPLVASFSVIKGIFVIAAYRNAKFRVQFWSGHIVFCGCGDQASTLIRQYLERENSIKIVVIDVNDSAERKALEARGVVFLEEDATSQFTLRQARVDRALCIYIMAGTDQTNLAIYNSFKQVIKEQNFAQRKDNSSCVVNLYDVTLKSLIDQQLQQPDHRIMGWDVRTINAWENSARKLLTGEHGPHLHCPDDQQPHILILGHSWLAEQLLIRGARLGHYSGRRKLRITYVDENAEHMRDMLYAQYPVLDTERVHHLAWHKNESKLLPVIDTCFIAKSPDSLTGKLYAQIIQYAPLSVAYICDSDDERAIRIFAALVANRSNNGGEAKPEIVLCDVHGHEGVGSYMNKDCKFGQAAYFDALKEGLKLASGELVVGGLREDWAKAIHDFYQIKYGGDFWENLSEEMRKSNRESADHWKVKFDWIKSKTHGDILDSLETFRDELMRMEHDRWCAERLMSGYRYCDKPGTEQEKIDAKVKKLNWCIGSFDDLSLEDKQKDEDVYQVAAKVYEHYK